MEPRYYDAAGRIRYDALSLYAIRLRREAIDAFWTALAGKAANLFAQPRHSDAYAGARRRAR